MYISFANFEWIYWNQTVSRRNKYIKNDSCVYDVLMNSNKGETRISLHISYTRLRPG